MSYNNPYGNQGYNQQGNYGQQGGNYGQQSGNYGQQSGGYRPQGQHGYQQPHGNQHQQGYSQGGYHGHQQHGAYGAPQNQAPPGIDPSVYAWFQAVDEDRSGKITSAELRQALINNDMKQFNPETCRLMIGMFDKDKDGTIDINEFSALWNYIQQWRKCFDSFDKDRSGNIDNNELHQALTAFGYTLSHQFSRILVSKFDKSHTNSIDFDYFIQVCVTLESLTNSFKKKDVNRTGRVSLQYEEFLTMVLDNQLNIV